MVRHSQGLLHSACPPLPFSGPSHRWCFFLALQVKMEHHREAAFSMHLSIQIKTDSICRSDVAGWLCLTAKRGVTWMECGQCTKWGELQWVPSTRGCNAGECKTCLLCSSTDLPWLLDGIGGADTPRLTNFTIVINKNRTLTKPHLLLVTLLNVKSNNQPLSSQNEINHVSV